MLSLIRGEWRLLLFGFLMMFWSAPGQTFFISLFSGQIRGEIGLTDGEFGAIYSLATLISALVIVWSGSLVDSMDLRRFSVISVAGLALGCLALAFSPSAALLLGSLFLLRHFGQGLMSLISSTTMVRYLEHGRGRATALASMGYAVCEAVAPFAVVSLMLWIGWRGSWMVFAAAAAVVMIPCALVLLADHSRRHQAYLDSLNRSGDAEDSGTARHWTRNEVLRDPRFYIFIPGLMSPQIMFTGFIFHQVRLVEEKGWSLPGWAALFAVYAVVSVLSKLVTGMLVDRMGALRLVAWASVPMGVGLAVLGMGSELVWGGVFLALLGVTVGYQSTVTAPFWAELYGSRHLGAIKSLVAFTMILLTATSPVVLGWLIDRGLDMNRLALGAAVYVGLATLLALYGVWLTRRGWPRGRAGRA